MSTKNGVNSLKTFLRSSPEIRCNIAEEVFLHVISNVDAGREDKLKLLMEIERHCPEIVRSIDEQKILEAFYDFVNNQKSVNLPKDIISSKLLSHEEIDWANRYCEKNNFQNEKIRYLVFRSMLIAGERMDKMRRHYKWGISKTMLKNWACDVAIGTGVFRFPLDIFKKVNIILEFDLEKVFSELTPFLVDMMLSFYLPISAPGHLSGVKVISFRPAKIYFRRSG